eukprot:gene8143-8336_t
MDDVININDPTRGSPGLSSLHTTGSLSQPGSLDGGWGSSGKTLQGGRGGQGLVLGGQGGFWGSQGSAGDWDMEVFDDCEDFGVFDLTEREARPQRIRPTAAKGSRGNPEDQTVADVSTNVVLAADDNTTTAASSVGPEAWCPNPATSYAGPEENYQACIILAYRPSGRIPWCSTSFVISKDSKYNIALTAAHCVSDAKNNFILDTGSHGGINQESIVCCAYDKTKGSACPSAYSYKIRSIKLYSSYHNGGLVTKDIAVLSVFNSPTGRIPGKWAVDNWDPDSGKRDWWVYGYPQYDDRAGAGPTCKKDFLGRRWSWGLNGPVINQPTSTSSSYLYGNACGGLSGAPVLDWRRKALTSVMSLTYSSCDSGGWGRIATAVIRGFPGGSPGLSNTNAGVDVYNLWKGF